MVALHLVRQLTCSGCGGHLPDTTAPDAAYVAELPIRCHQCTAMGIQSDGYRGDDVSQPHALRFPVRPRKGGGRG